MDAAVSLRAGSRYDGERSTLAVFTPRVASWVSYVAWLLVIALGMLLVIRQARLHAMLMRVLA